KRVRIVKFNALNMRQHTHLKKFGVFVTMLLTTLSFNAQNWKPAGDKIKTKWAEQIDVNSVLPEYPRPILKREQWKNLNGLWDYSIQGVGQPEPSKWDGKILVPFAVESSLSGVGKRVGH